MPIPTITIARAIRNIISAADRNGRGRIAAAAVAALAGLFLLSLAAPRIVGDIMVAPHGELFQRLERLHPDHPARRNYAADTGRAPVTFDEVLIAIERYQAALAWRDSADYRLKLGRLYFVAARLIGGTILAAETLFRQSMESYAVGLAGAPANPVDWTRLAVATYATEGATPYFSAVLGQAVRAAPVAPDLIAERTRLGLAAWPKLGADTRQLVAAQVALAVELVPERLGAILEDGAARRLARDLLAPRPDLLERFERAVAG
jgi:hypothetical protein